MNIEDERHYFIIEHPLYLPFCHPCCAEIIILAVRIAVLTATVIRLGLASIVFKSREVRSYTR